MILFSLSTLFLIHSVLGADIGNSFDEIRHPDTTSMGKANEVWTRSINGTYDNLKDITSAHQRPKDFDLCQATCKTYCEKPILNGGPDVEDCMALASYYANGGDFTIEPLKYVVWEYKTCRVTQYNRLKDHNQRIRYCFDQNHWAGVVTHITSHCGSDSGSHGGSCYFYDSLHYSSMSLEKV